MAVADLPHPLEVPRRRGEAAAGVLHGLEVDGRDRVRTLPDDGPLDLVRRPLAEGDLVVGEDRCPVEVGVGDLDGPAHQGFEGGLEVRDPGDGQGTHGRPVVGDVAADDLGALGLAGLPEVLPGQLPRRLDRLGPAGGEEDAVELTGRVPGQALGQLDGAGVGVGPQGEVGQRAGLLRSRLGQLGAPVAQLRGEEAGQTIQVALAVLVPHVGTLAAHHHRDLVGLVGAHAAEVHPEVATGLLAQTGILGIRTAHWSSTQGADGGGVAPTGCPMYTFAWPASNRGTSPWRARRGWTARSR